MLHIRPDQLATFEDLALREFIVASCKRLRRQFPEQTEVLEEDALRTQVESGIARAGSSGITLNDDVTRFLHLQVELGTDFDSELEWVRSILADAHLDGKNKMRQISIGAALRAEDRP